MREVTVPLHLAASMTFHVDDDEVVTPELVREKVQAATRAVDRQGNDPITGIYFTIEGHDEPDIYEV